MSQFKVIATHPLDLPDGTTGAPGQIVDCDPSDVAGAVGDRLLVPVSVAHPQPEPVGDVPDGTVHDVVGWIGDDPARAQAALDKETAGENRKGIVQAAEALLDTTTTEETTE